MSRTTREVSNRTYSISQLAEEFGVTARSIRFYEDQQLLSPERVGRNRLFHERDRVRLKLILRGKRLGFSLAEIREMFDLYDSEPGEAGQLRYLLESLDRKRAALRQQREDIDAVLAEMDEVEQRVRTSLAQIKQQA